MSENIKTSNYNFQPYWKILLKKRKRVQKINERDDIDDIESHGEGKCIHVGKISPGCRGCFVRQTYIGYGGTTKLGEKCNIGNCPYCLEATNDNGTCGRKVDSEEIRNRLAKYYKRSLRPNEKARGFAFSNGEPLLYMDEMEKFGNLFKDIERREGVELWNKLYTNGLLLDEDKLKKLKEWKIKEIRFHVSASDFSDKVFENMKKAKKMGFVVGVEEPAYPPNEKKLIKHLEIFDEIGVNHMQLCETKVYDFNIDNILEDYSNYDNLPTPKFYYTNRPFLYHEGMTYRVMETVLEKDYDFSVLDCNSEVWSYNHSQDKHKIEFGDIEEAFADYGKASKPPRVWEKVDEDDEQD